MHSIAFFALFAFASATSLAPPLQAGDTCYYRASNNAYFCGNAKLDCYRPDKTSKGTCVVVLGAKSGASCPCAYGFTCAMFPTGPSSSGIHCIVADASVKYNTHKQKLGYPCGGAKYAKNPFICQDNLVCVTPKDSEEHGYCLKA
jgi:hypothetical protein